MKKKLVHWHKSLGCKIGIHKTGAKSQGSVTLTMSKVANSPLI